MTFTSWKTLGIVVGMLALLTYLLVQSRGPNPRVQAQLHEGIHEFERHDAMLNQNLLLARAGLLPHYDALSQGVDDLYQTLDTLRGWQATRSGDEVTAIHQQLTNLSKLLEYKETRLDYFKSDNAILRNSLMYVINASNAILMRSDDSSDVISVVLGKLANALFRFMRTQQTTAGNEIRALLDMLLTSTPFDQDLHTLAAHSRLIMQILPQVDIWLRQSLETPVVAQVQALRDAFLHYHKQVEERAQIYRFLLYGVALALLGYLTVLFARLRARTRSLIRTNSDLQYEIAERRQAEVALRESEERFRTMTETARDAIVVTDSAGDITFWNRGAQRMFGYDDADVLGTSLATLVPALGSELAFNDRTPREEAETTSDENLAVECLGRRRDGNVFPLEFTVSSWKTLQGTYQTSIIRDITDRKHLEAKTHQQERQLIQASKMTALGTLVAGVAHEINNPNQLVLMNSQILAESWRDMEPILDAYQQEQGDFLLSGLTYSEMRETLPALIGDVHDGAKRIERIVSDLKNFSRPRDKVVYGDVRLNEVVEQALTLLQHRINKMTSTFHARLEPDLPLIYGDSQHLEQIVVNLVVNALESLPSTDCQVTVTTQYDPVANNVELEVRDEGIGISKSDLDRLCDPFFTTKNDQGGTGLGLAVTYTLVQNHGGHLIFTSTPGQGTCALVTLPCQVATKPSVSASQPSYRSTVKGNKS